MVSLRPILAACFLLAAPATAAERAFIAIETADIAQVESWYAKAFDAKRVNRFDRTRFEQRILVGPDVVVELIAMKPPSPDRAGQVLGIAKTGLQISDFDARLAAWRKSGIAGKGGLVFDEAVGLASIQLIDPEGNRIQVFGKSAGPFDHRVKVDPAFTAASGN